MNHASRPSSFRVGSKLRLSRSFLQTQTPPSVCVCVCACACRSSFFSVYPSFCLSIYIISHPCICCTCFPMCIYQSIYLPTYRHVCVDIGRKCTWLSIFVDPKVHIEIVHCKGRQGSKRRPRKVYIWVRESLSFFTQKAKYFNMRPPRKINVGFAKDSQNFFFIREEWPFAEKGI